MDTIPFGDLSRQYKKYRNEFDSITKTVFEKGNFILGENVAGFEEEFASYCGCRYGAGVGSGTEALHLALLACGIKPGDEVITVANTAVPTAAAIRLSGAVPVFADIEAETYNIDPSLIQPFITENTKAILPVHLYGNTCEIDKIMDIAKKHGLKVIEDCAQCHGAEFKGRKAGSFGHAGCFSFYPSKNLGAFGDGGMIVTNDAEIAERIKLLRNYGQQNRYFSKIEGTNSRLDELQAAYLRFKLTHLEEWNAKRIEIAGRYNDAFRETGLILPFHHKYCRHVYHLYVVRVKNRDRFMGRLEEKGVKTLIHYPYPIHLQDAYKNAGIGNGPGSLPITEKIAEEIVSLPIYPELTDEEVKYIIKTVIEFFNE